MAHDALIRRVLWVSAAYNLGGAIVFAFPSSPVGRLGGLASETPVLYRALVALFVALFAGAYAWLARQPRIDRPMVALAAIGKAGAFATFVLCWMLGEFAGAGVIAGCGDLILAAFFGWWLIASSG